MSASSARGARIGSKAAIGKGRAGLALAHSVSGFSARQFTGAAASCRTYATRAPGGHRSAGTGALQGAVTVSRETYDKLRRAQDLLRHAIPSGDPAAVFDRALTMLVAHLEKTKLAATQKPRAARLPGDGSRHVPAAVRRAVWARDGGQCAFIGASGRCCETGFLEFHHLVPYAAGGAASVDNLQLRCKPHNAYEAEQYFGPREPWLLREDAAVFVSALNSVQTELRRRPAVLPFSFCLSALFHNYGDVFSGQAARPSSLSLSLANGSARSVRVNVH